MSISPSERAKVAGSSDSGVYGIVTVRVTVGSGDNGAERNWAGYPVDPHIGFLLPCSVVVRESAGGGLFVAADGDGMNQHQKTPGTHSRSST